MAPNSKADAVSSPPPPPTVPFDLVVEILCRLPVKALLRFRSVCKSWKSLISDPKFAKIHLRRSPTDFTRHHLLLNYNISSDNYLGNYSGDYVYTDFSLLSILNAAIPAPTTQFRYNQKGFYYIVGSCDGIICLEADYGSSIILWNPSLRRFNILPPPSTSTGNPRPDTTYGFGYDNISDTYKIVAVSHCKYYQTQVKVHTLGTDSWRGIQEFPPSCKPFIGTRGVFVSGTLNWLSSHDAGWFIISLDLGNECYKKLLPPQSGVESLGVLRDCLSILSDDYEVCNVWLMKEYGNQKSWTKLFSLTRQLFHYAKVNDALYLSEDDELLVMFGSQLYLYNSRDNILKTPQIQNITGWVFPGVYVESLMGF